MKMFFCLISTALMCTSCANTPSEHSQSGLTMYGVIDTGITVHD